MGCECHTLPNRKSLVYEVRGLQAGWEATGIIRSGNWGSGGLCQVTLTKDTWREEGRLSLLSYPEAPDQRLYRTRTEQEPWTEGQGNSGSYSFSWMQKASWKEHSSSLQPCHLPLAGYHFNPGVLEQPLSVNQSFFSETATLVFKMMAFFPYHSEINITKAWPYVH